MQQRQYFAERSFLSADFKLKFKHICRLFVFFSIFSLYRSPLFRRPGLKMCTRRYAYFDEVKIKWHSALFVPALPYYCHVQPSYRNSCLVPTLYVSSLPPPTLSPYSRRHYSHFVLSAFAPFSFFLPFGCLPLLPRHRALCILFVTLVKGAAPSFKSLSLSLSLSFSLWPRSELHVLDSP